MQYIDQVVQPIKQKYARPIKIFNGGAKFVDTSNISSGKAKRINYQYNDLQHNSGNQSTQSALQEYLKRNPAQPRKSQAGGALYHTDQIPSLKAPREFNGMYYTDKLYHK